MRYKLTIEYDGTGLAGWQRQANALTVQQLLEEAITAFCGEAVTVHGAGRTDAGVHARGQVAHIDLERPWPPGTVRDAINAHLRPHPIAVLAVEGVSPDFHARFDATCRTYLYRMIDRRAPLALEQERAWHIRQPLDVAAMDMAAQALVGHHDFTTFRDGQCQARSPVKTLDRIAVSRHGDVVGIRVSARSFLHRQVRSIAGSLKKVGDGSWPPEKIAAILAARDRRKCGPVALAHGLYLVGVSYEPRPDDK
jgi:tRNA pseudouridine38-40 synthase